jgi:Hemerythrin HHE cation binding domain
MTLRAGGTLEELLRQHDVIRNLCTRCGELIDIVEREPAQVGELVEAVARLRWAVTSHNRLEEQMLAPMLEHAEEGGREHDHGAAPDGEVAPLEQRVADHRKEHRSLGLALEKPTLDSLRQTLSLLREHLEDEECHFFAARVLREDLRASQSTG